MSESRYFVNAWVDHGAMGVLSVAAFLVALALPESATASGIAAAGFLQWVVNWPHFSATAYRLYRTPQNRRQYPVTAYVVPFLVLAGIALSLYDPKRVAPYFIKFFMIWSPYHFAAQALGLSLVYARRAGYGISPRERLLLSGFIFGTFLVSTGYAETTAAPPSYYGVSYPGLGLSRELVHGFEWLMYACGAAFLARAAWRWGAKRERIPSILLVPAAALYVWFVVGYHAPAFYPFVPLFHSLQYLLIAWVMGLRESGATSVRKASAQWYAVNFLGGAALFFVFPELLRRGGLPKDLALAVGIAGVQIHHFFVDGVIWKLRNATVANPLVVSLGRAA